MHEQPEQTIGLTNNAGQRPASGRFRLVATADQLASALFELQDDPLDYLTQKNCNVLYSYY